MWLLDEKGADVNAATWNGYIPIHWACSLAILNALLDRGADPTLTNDNGTSPLMWQASEGDIGIMAHLLQDPRVRATVNLQNGDGDTALHWACESKDETSATFIVHLLLQAGCDPTLTDNYGMTPLVYLQQEYPSYHAAIALLEHAPDAEKASLLVKVRRLAAVSRNAEAPSYLHGCVARGQPLLWVQLPRAMPPRKSTSGQNKRLKEDCKLRNLVAVLLGMEGGPKGEGMPRDVFWVVLDLLMPTWDPLRCKNAVAAPPPVP